MSNYVTKASECVRFMNSDELDQLIDVICLRRQYLTKEVIRSVRIGDTVTFDTRDRTVVGEVTKVARKNLVVMEHSQNTRWKVAAGLVQKIEKSDNLAQSY